MGSFLRMKIKNSTGHCNGYRLAALSNLMEQTTRRFSSLENQEKNIQNVTYTNLLSVYLLVVYTFRTLYEMVQNEIEK